MTELTDRTTPFALGWVRPQGYTSGECHCRWRCGQDIRHGVCEGEKCDCASGSNDMRDALTDPPRVGRSPDGETSMRNLILLRLTSPAITERLNRELFTSQRSRLCLVNTYSRQNKIRPRNQWTGYCKGRPTSRRLKETRREGRSVSSSTIRSSTTNPCGG